MSICASGQGFTVVQHPSKFVFLHMYNNLQVSMTVYCISEHFFFLGGGGGGVRCLLTTWIYLEDNPLERLIHRHQYSKAIIWQTNANPKYWCKNRPLSKFNHFCVAQIAIFPNIVFCMQTAAQAHIQALATYKIAIFEVLKCPFCYIGDEALPKLILVWNYGVYSSLISV